MKKDLHPNNYRLVVFQDINNGSTFLTRSTAETEDTIELNNITYPLVKIHISSASHPFFTGQEKLVDIEGRVDRFKAQVEASKNRRAELSKTPKASNKDKSSKPITKNLSQIKSEE